MAIGELDSELGLSFDGDYLQEDLLLWLAALLVEVARAKKGCALLGRYASRLERYLYDQGDADTRPADLDMAMILAQVWGILEACTVHWPGDDAIRMAEVAVHRRMMGAWDDAKC